MAWLYEDELPDNYPYEAMFPYSKVDGVRMFPVYVPQSAEPCVSSVSDKTTCRSASGDCESQRAEPDEWKLAVDHELTNMQSTADSYPSAKEAVKSLIDWHVAVATAPVFQQPTEPVLDKYQPCGCVVCTCEDEVQCQGCGARHCGTHPIGELSDPVYVSAEPFSWEDCAPTDEGAMALYERP